MVCNSNVVPGQWTCHVVDTAASVWDLAVTFHMHPQRLFEYNSLSLPSISSEVPAGFELRVPGAPCESVASVWDCYRVEDGDTFESINDANTTLVRNLDSLIALNEDLMWGSTVLFAGMDIRRPHPFCVPGPSHECHDVSSAAETLGSIAALHGTDEATLRHMNAATLGMRDALVAGMELEFPRRFVDAPLEHGVCSPIESVWDCHVVEAGDTLNTIASRFRANPAKICEVNQLSSCDDIWAGQSLAIPVHSCEPKEGRWSCFARDSVSNLDEYYGVQFYDTRSSASDTRMNGQSNHGLDVDVFAEANSAQLSAVGDWEVYPGQEVVFPFKNCLPSLAARCYYLKEGETLDNAFDGILPEYHLGYLYNFAGNKEVDSRYRKPRAGQSLWLPNWSPMAAPWGAWECIDTPGSHFCYKVQQDDTIFDIAQSCQLQSDDLCAFNNMANCEMINYQNSAIKIPIL